MTYVFDLDGTLCETEGLEYARATPIESRIAKVNELYDAGHTIVIDTARGTITGENWWVRTNDQLTGWGLKFHGLRTGEKPYGDYYIDDKGWTADEFFACES